MLYRILFIHCALCNLIFYSTCNNINPQIPSQSFKKVFSLISATSSTLYGLYLASESIYDNDFSGHLHTKLFNNIETGSKVLEVGFGTGANYDYYPSPIHLIGIDPYLKNQQMLVDKYQVKNIDLKLLDGVCENLPFSENTFDFVVSTLVFCTVRDPANSLSEIIRVLKPNGFFLCVEHIHDDPNSFLGKQQTLFEPLQEKLGSSYHFIVIYYSVFLLKQNSCILQQTDATLHVVQICC